MKRIQIAHTLTNNNRPSSRVGAVLLLVLLAVVLLSFAAYSFSELMLAEHVVSRSLIHQMELRSLAQSGAESAAALVDERARSELETPGWWQDSQRFERVALTTLSDGVTPGFFTIVPNRRALIGHVGANRQSANAGFGLTNESGKLNVNSLPLDKQHRKTSRLRLLALPQMTPPIADAILDWMDPDDDRSAFGAETAYYSALSMPYRPRQKRFESFDEFLLVRGVTPELLYGNESVEPPRPGWVAFLTLSSAESTRQRGSLAPKINVNHPELVELFDRLNREFGIDAARFIVAWRINGGVTVAENERVAAEAFLNWRDNLQTQAFGPAMTDPNADPDLMQAEAESAILRAKKQLGNNDEFPNNGTAGIQRSDNKEKAITRGGLNLSRAPTYTIHSVLDLIGTDVRIDVDHRETVIKSPWHADERSLEQSIRLLESGLTTTDAQAMPGRINVEHAPREVLLSIPGLTPIQADAILAARASSGHNPPVATRRQSIGWLVTEGIVTLPELRQFAAEITTGGDVWRGVSTGHSSISMARCDAEFVLDASIFPARVRFWHEISVAP